MTQITNFKHSSPSEMISHWCRISIIIFYLFGHILLKTACISKVGPITPITIDHIIQLGNSNDLKFYLSERHGNPSDRN